MQAGVFNRKGFLICLVCMGALIVDIAFCGQATLRVTIRGVDQPRAEERLAIFETSGFIAAWWAKYTRQDLSGIAVTCRDAFLRQEMTKRTDKDGVVLFEGLSTAEGHELTAACDVVIGGRTVRAKARTYSTGGECWLRLYTDWVTLKGRVLDPNGKPLGGVHVKVVPMPFEFPFSQFAGLYPPQTAVSGSNGVYELPDVRPLNMKTTASYLVNSNAAVRAVAYFIAEIYAGKTEAAFMRDPCLTLPLISADMLQHARRYNDFRKKWLPKAAGKTGWAEQEGLYLPESKGDVIFLPDIVVADDPSEVRMGRPPADERAGAPSSGS